MIERSIERAPQLGAVIEAVASLKRAAEPDEVANAILFLCSPASSYVNGTSIIIDGGLSLTLQLH